MSMIAIARYLGLAYTPPNSQYDAVGMVAGMARCSRATAEQIVAEFRRRWPGYEDYSICDHLSSGEFVVWGSEIAFEFATSYRASTCAGCLYSCADHRNQIVLCSLHPLGMDEQSCSDWRSIDAA